MTTPPPFAERLLRAAVRDPEWRDAITGDLREELASLAARRGAAVARRWYWRQAVPLALRFVVGRVVPSATPSRQRVSIRDVEAASTLGAGWSRELRHAWRGVTQRPGLSAVIVTTLALALTANAVVFTLGDALYLRPFRFPDVDRLLLVSSDTNASALYLDRESVTPGDFRDWQHEAASVEALAASEFWDPNLSGIDVPEQLPGVHVTAGFFDVLRVSPVLGRTLRLDGDPHEVIGVMPPRFAIPYGADVWAPLALDAAAWQVRRNGSLMVIGRLAPGRSLADARAEFTALAARQAEAHPETNRARSVTVLSFTRGLGDDAVGPLMVVWQAAALLVLVVACANIANLLLARATERQAELTVRLALGASRARLVLQLLLEGACLAVLGLGLGAGLTMLAMQSARTMLPPSVVRFVPGLEFIRLDPMTIAAMVALGAVATLGCSLLPALHATGGATGASLVRGMRGTTASAGSQWIRSMLAGAQVAFSLALIVAAVLIVAGVRRAADGAMGFDKQGLMTAELNLAERPYAKAARRRQFLETALQRLAAEPGITAVAAASTVPYAQGFSQRDFHREGAIDADARAETRTTDLVRVTPAFFETMAVRFVEGRGFGVGDGADAPPVAIVSRVLAERYFDGASPLGRRFRLGDDGPWITVVGVADDVIQDWLSGQRRPTVYRPLAQDPTLHLTLLARSAQPETALAEAMRRAVRAADPDQPILKLAPMTQVVSDRLAGLGYFANMLTAMSVVALGLAVTGMYSLMAYVAARRTPEFGVRVALGATRSQVTWLGVSRALGITGGGLVLGGVLAVAVGRVMQATLFGLVQSSTAVVVAAVAGLGAIALVAGDLPARRAAAQDPWQALRTD